MTRETKVGLVVSCSFLCLVGVVVVCKLRGNTTDLPSADAQAVHEVPADPSEVPPAPEAAQVADAGPKPSGPQPANLERLQPTPPAIQQTSAPEGPSQEATPVPTTVPNNGSEGKAGQTDGRKPPSLPPENSPAPPAPPVPAATPPPPPAPTLPAPAPTTTQPEGKDTSTSPPADLPRESFPPREQKPEEKAAAEATPPPPPVPALPTPAAEAPSPAPPASTTPPAALTRPQPVTPAGTGDNNLKEKTQVAEPPPAPAPAAGVHTPDPVPEPPPVPAPPAPAGVSTPPAPNGDKSAAVPTEPATPEKPIPAASPAQDKPIPSAADDMHDKVKLAAPVMPPTAPTEVAQATPPMPPVGAVPTATSPPIVVAPSAVAPRPPAVPQVESFPEETYRCRPGDTFEAISQGKYNTPKYAQALLQFNRNHPLAGDNLQTEAPALRNGQTVFIPPVSILEKRYATAIRDLSPLPAPPASALPATGGVGAAAPAPTGYRVRGNGEWLRDVARETLGNSERWQEIWQLNPTVDYRSPLPANTVLRLPAGARIPTQNLP
jgi:hypothetical protein